MRGACAIDSGSRKAATTVRSSVPEVGAGPMASEQFSAPDFLDDFGGARYIVAPLRE